MKESGQNLLYATVVSALIHSVIYVFGVLPMLNELACKNPGLSRVMGDCQNSQVYHMTFFVLHVSVIASFFISVIIGYFVIRELRQKNRKDEFK